MEEIKSIIDRFERDFERMSKDFERMMSEFDRLCKSLREFLDGRKTIIFSS